MRIVMILSVLLLSNFATAGEVVDPLEEFFTPLACAELLVQSDSTDLEALTQAEAFVSWVLLEHSAARSLIARHDGSMDLLYDLLFLSTGYLVPPTPDGYLGKSSEANRRYDAGIRFEITGKKASTRAGRKYLASKFERFGQESRTGAVTEGATILLANVILRSAIALRNVTNGWNRYGSDTEEYRPIQFQSKLAPLYDANGAKTDLKQGFSIKWGRTFSTAEFDELSATLSHLENPRIRSSVVKRLWSRLPAIVADSRKLCRAWNTCANLGEAKAFLAQTRPVGEETLEPRPNIVEPPRLIVPASSQPRRPALVKPVPFESEAIERFVSDHSRPEGEVDSFAAVVRELQSATDLLIEAVFQLQSWRSQDIDWVSWNGRLQATTESISNLRYDLNERQASSNEALAELEKGSSGLSDLRAWVSAMTQHLGRNDLEAAATDLSPHDQTWLTNALNMAATLDRLTEDAIEAIRWRQRRVIDTVDTLFQLQVMIAKVGEGLIRDSGAQVPLEQLEEFEKLREFIASLARPGQE